MKIMMMFMFINFKMFNLIQMIIMMSILLNFKMEYLNIQFIVIMVIIFMFILSSYFMMFIKYYMSFALPMKLMYMSLMMSMMFMMFKNMFFMFMFFEMSIIPVFVYMLFFSPMEKKMNSSFYLILYTSIFSFIFFWLVIIEFKYIKTNNIILFLFFFISNMNLYKTLILLIFFTKIPIFFLHIWLPKAHVDSSTMGSMILASILLKLGGIGMIIFMNSIKMMYMLNYLIYFFYLSSIYMIMLCMFINDLKMIIAYFSISHMSLALISLMINDYNSSIFCILLMSSHSISSPILFFITMILYNSYSSRMMIKINSMFNLSNSFTWLFLLFILMNISIPPTMNFFSEILIFFISLKYCISILILMMILIMVSGLTSIMLVLKLMMSKEVYSFKYMFIMKLNSFSIFLVFIYFSLILLLKFMVM